LGVLTVSKTHYSDGSINDIRNDWNKATFGIWEELGWVIKDHFNIGLSFSYIISNSTKNVWGHNDAYGNWVTHKHYSPQLQFQIVLGWRFNPYKMDKKKIEAILIE